MKISSTIKTGCLLLTLIVAGRRVSAQTDSTKVAEDWVKSRVWAHGLKISVYPDINNLEFYRQYRQSKELWEKVFNYLSDVKNLDTLKAGMYPVDGKNAYASVTEGQEKTIETAKWESHRKYIDLQYVIKGKERIDVTPIANATVTVPYNETKDGANYTAEGKSYVASPKEFYLFFPSDVHRPNIHVEGYDIVKKVVIKIRYTQ